MSCHFVLSGGGTGSLEVGDKWEGGSAQMPGNPPELYSQLIGKRQEWPRYSRAGGYRT